MNIWKIIVVIVWGLYSLKMWKSGYLHQMLQLCQDVSSVWSWERWPHLPKTLSFKCKDPLLELEVYMSVGSPPHLYLCETATPSPTDGVTWRQPGTMTWSLLHVVLLIGTLVLCLCYSDLFLPVLFDLQLLCKTQESPCWIGPKAHSVQYPASNSRQHQWIQRKAPLPCEIMDTFPPDLQL